MSNPMLMEFIQEELDYQEYSKKTNAFQALFHLIFLISMVLILIEAFGSNFG